ncbi:diphosphate--fructose-6-phosphate 1-phosphotransferase [Companilactobacillus formosensis]|uniref:diphosphate--fructose-6-phosphate 1-phosphotransferase n=1 Tax=Companilactobacillus formosensis TaxID=1617889 RepID=UPI000E657559|nr:diphosphate--fructose-6-phosphate 1-phosphotransferase [Companilactobacillus formosensis]
MKNNLLVIHGGGPTVVLNSSLYGVVIESQKHKDIIDKIYGAKNGVEGLLKDKFIDLGNKTSEEISSLLTSPGTAIGSSRYPLSDTDYEKMIDHLIKNNIKYVLMSGGNGTMGTCGNLSKLCKKRNVDIKVIGIPKTMDNDINIIDHAPGYLSAAKYIIQTTREIVADVHSLPIHVCIIEVMGRNAGWLAASSCCSSNGDDLQPDLIYVPECAFDEEKFLRDVKAIYDKKGYATVVVSEGLKKANGDPIVPEIFRQGRSVYYGEVGNYLANEVIKKLKIKARNEKPGLAGRSSIYLQSAIDRNEAVEVGKRAVMAAINNQTDKMVGIFRDMNDGKYSARYDLVNLDDVMMTERKLPLKFINEDKNGITSDFAEWLNPMLLKTDYFPIVNFN